MVNYQIKQFNETKLAGMKSLSSCRTDFPSLSRSFNGRELVYLDGPGGSQVPEMVIEAISHYYRTSNSNTHGSFITTIETDEVIQKAREHMAVFLGASSPETISFGQNMTSLNYSLSKALSRYLKPGSEIMITQLDHEANRGPWLALEADGFVIQEVKITADGKLDYQDFQNKLSSNTSLVAVGYASNAMGTVNDLSKIRSWTRDTNTLMLVDAVHYAPHFSIDVQEIDSDFLLCSAYKFYGPHVGILHCKPGLLNELNPDRLTTQDQGAPHRIETGTLNHAAIAGVSAAIEYLASYGTGTSERERLVSTMTQIGAQEFEMYTAMCEGLEKIPAIEIIGPPADAVWHTPTVSFTMQGFTALEVCELSGSQGSLCLGWSFLCQKSDRNAWFARGWRRS